MAQAQVRRRRVCYIPGYDPMPPRRYRELYRREGAAQAALRGYEVALHKGLRSGWDVEARIERKVVDSAFEVLVWSDIVRDSMGAGVAATYWQMCRTAWVYLSTGTLWRLMGLRKGPVIAAFYPLVMLLAQLSIGIAIAVVLEWIAGGVVPAAVAWLGSVVAPVSVLRWFLKMDGRFFA